jgi:hypothetical protein
LGVLGCSDSDGDCLDEFLKAIFAGLDVAIKCYCSWAVTHEVLDFFLGCADHVEERAEGCA